MGVTQKEMGVTQDNTKHTKMQETDRMQTDHMMDQESFHFSDAGDGGSDAQSQPLDPFQHIPCN